MGGYLIPAIDFLVTEGVCKSSCKPYKSRDEKCNARSFLQLPFLHTHDSGFGYACADKDEPYDKYYCKAGSFKIMNTVEEIQRELYESGPVIVSLNVWEDFMNYGGGVYEHVRGGFVGGHSIRIVGWGHDDENDGHLYWIGQN